MKKHLFPDRIWQLSGLPFLGTTGAIWSINYAAKELFQHFPHQATGRRWHNTADMEEIACAWSPHHLLWRGQGWKVWGCGDQYPGQFVIHWGTLIRRLCFKGGGEESRGVRKGTVALECSASLAVEVMPSITQFQWQIHFSGRWKLGPKTCHGAVATVQTTAHKSQPGIWMWEPNRMEHLKSEGYSLALHSWRADFLCREDC